MQPFFQTALLGAMALLCGALGFGGTPPAEPVGMIRVPAGEFSPFLREARSPSTLPVPAFWMDRCPVTKGEFLGFVREKPEWRRSRARRLFADQGYLAGWRGDLEPGSGDPAELRQPVTQVSWFAARAYAQWKGLRLPTTAEWERAAALGFTRENGSLEPAFLAALDQWYGGGGGAGPASPVGQGRPNLLGIHDLHGLIWEWTSDFNSLFVDGDARNAAGLDRTLFCAGGSLSARDRNDFATFMRYGFRSSLKAAYTVHNLGFRCAWTP